MVSISRSVEKLTGTIDNRLRNREMITLAYMDVQRKFHHLLTNPVQTAENEWHKQKLTQNNWSEFLDRIGIRTNGSLVVPISGQDSRAGPNQLTNNTSLVLAIEFAKTGKVLLLPADAQSGNWMSWHKPEVVERLKENGGKNTDELLANTVFYKVGHHGSHNGTASMSGLEKITSRDLVAFMPLVQDKVPSVWGGADNFPAGKLHGALIEKTKGRIIRTDEGIITDERAVKLRNGLTNVETNHFKKAFKKGDCYFEYTIYG